jgi:hypothetical protein
MEQIEAMRERLKVQNAHIIEAQKQNAMKLEKKQETKPILEEKTERLTWEDQVQAEPITVQL